MPKWIIVSLPSFPPPSTVCPFLLSYGQWLLKTLSCRLSCLLTSGWNQPMGGPGRRWEIRRRLPRSSLGGCRCISIRILHSHTFSSVALVLSALLCPLGPRISAVGASWRLWCLCWFFSPVHNSGNSSLIKTIIKTPSLEGQLFPARILSGNTFQRCQNSHIIKNYWNGSWLKSRL